MADEINNGDILSNWKKRFENLKSATPKSFDQATGINTQIAKGDLASRASPWAGNSTPGKKTDTTKPPPKADAAPSSQSITVYTGLCDALNEFQNNLKQSGTYGIADQYEIVFLPSTIGQEKITLPEGLAYKTTPMANSKNANAQANPATDSMATTGRIFQVQAGTQIIQAIDQIMKTSTYVTKQANTATAENTGTATPTANKVTPTSGTKWYKITFGTKDLGYDVKRNTNAYKMTFYINEYVISNLESQFFAPGAFRGVHKSYKYWFTGQNTQVLNFEQDYNNLYFQILSSPADGTGDGRYVPAGLSTNDRIDPINNLAPIPKAFAAGTSQSSQFSENGAGLIGSSASDFLYSTSNRGQIRMKIIGDPAWLQQGEICNTVSAQSFSWNPWNADNGINFEASQIFFDVTFCRPADYDFEKGIIDVNAPAKDPVTKSNNLMQPQAQIIYQASSVTSTFSKGKFEQELTGLAYTQHFYEQTKNAEATKKNTEANTAAGSRQAIIGPDGNITEASKVDPNRWDSEPSSTSNPAASENSISKESTQPQAPAQPATSNGGIQNTVNNPFATSNIATVPTVNNNSLLGSNSLTPGLTPTLKTNVLSQQMAPKDA